MAAACSLARPRFMLRGGGLVLLVTLGGFTAAFPAEVPLDLEISFERAEALIDETVTLVVPGELRNRVVTHKRLMSKFDFPLGRAVTAVLPAALASRYGAVELAEVAPPEAAGMIIELSALDVEPDFPATTFGPYRATVTLGVRVHRAGVPTSLTVTGEGSSQDSVGRVLFQSPARGMKQDWIKLGRATGIALDEALDELLAGLLADAPASALEDFDVVETATEPR